MKNTLIIIEDCNKHMKNPRQIQAFQTNPMFVWKPVPCADSYTFKLERKDTPSYIVWERTLTTLGAKTIEEPSSPGQPTPQDIPEVLNLEKFVNKDGADSLMFTYSKDLPILNELTPYILSITANHENDILAYSQAEIIIFEKRVRESLQEFNKYISDLRDRNKENKDIVKNFNKFIGNITMDNASGPVPPWYDFECFSLVFS